MPTREQTAAALAVLDDLVVEHGDGRAAEALRMLAAERDQLLADRPSPGGSGVGGEASGALWMALRYALGRTSCAPGDENPQDPHRCRGMVALEQQLAEVSRG